MVIDLDKAKKKIVFNIVFSRLILHVRERENVFKLVELQERIPPEAELRKQNFAMTFPPEGNAEAELCEDIFSPTFRSRQAVP